MTYQEFDAVIRLPAQTVPIASRGNDQIIERIARLEEAVAKVEKKFVSSQEHVDKQVAKLQDRLAQLTSERHKTIDVQSELFQLMGIEDKLMELGTRIARQENDEDDAKATDMPADSDISNERQNLLSVDDLLEKLPVLAQTKKHTDFVIWYLRLWQRLSTLEHLTPSTQMWLILHKIEQGDGQLGHLISRSHWKDITMRVPGYALITGGCPQGFIQTAAPFVTVQDMLDYIGKTCFQVNISYI